MKFGPVPVAEAEGTILAHTLRTESTVIKKGRVLEAADVAALEAAGYAELVVARLEDGDVAEDAAATRVAEAVVGSGVRVAESFTGRANLYATERGVLVVDAPAVGALNRVDEAVTLATIEPFSVVEPGTMIATAKIIPFAVAAPTLEAALEAVGAGALRVAPFRARPAGLVLTELPGQRPAVLERAAESQRVRLERCGATLGRELRCPHEPAAVAVAIGELLDAGCDPVLVLGASAIVDRGDVVPAAVEAAGGTIEHLGMPVDPGNLLLLARHGDTPVIGVPGCARSLKPSGFDRVLSRIAADLPVAGADLAAMGAGGLLKEMPTRPQPREAEAATGGEGGVVALVLAAGDSRRMPDANKLLCDVEGAPMVARVVDPLAAHPGLAGVTVVTGHEAEAVRAALAGRAVDFVHNPAFKDGLSASLRAGVEAVADKVDAVLVCLGDMPWVGSGVVTALLEAFDREDPRVCVPVHDRKRGNPVLWPARYFDAIRGLSGDQGARRLLDEFAEEVVFVPVAHEGVNLDIDTPEALATLRRPAADDAS